MQSPRGLPLGSVLQKHRAFTTLRCGRIFYIVFLSHHYHVLNQSLTTADVEPVKQENQKKKKKNTFDSTNMPNKTKKSKMQSAGIHDIRCI